MVPFKLWGIPFVLVGCYIVFGRFFVDALSRSRTYYGVSNERILIVRGAFTQQFKSLDLGKLGEVSLTERGDESGSITFGPTFYVNRFYSNSSWPGQSSMAPPSFELIEQAREVYDIIRKAQTAGSSSG